MTEAAFNNLVLAAACKSLAQKTLLLALSDEEIKGKMHRQEGAAL